MKKFIYAGLMVVAATPGITQAARAETGIKIGVLSCIVDGGVGYVLGSAKPVDCVFHANGKKKEYYHGVIRKLGVDIGITDQTSISWAVIAPGSLKRGALKGYYGGATAEVTPGAGFGANVLIGGFKKSISLQPVSLQSQTGINVAAGLASMSLMPSGPKK